MANPNDVSPSTEDSGLATEHSKNSQSRPSRLNQALAWVGIVTGGLFVVAAVFFSGFFLSWSLDGSPSGGHRSPAPMACCDEMKKGEAMRPGAMMAPNGPMKPGEMMPGATMGPAPQSPAPTPPHTPRP
ncbi:hypothetical protein OK015_11990 [Mycobacterium sp. Aquia_216]|uniref:hypothetical protein n=1 Tax=Mycobacterium sp. Aquia_216 TaxID=2991729 RepID=UPI00227D2CAF|nr:hypothetical protein [Mycobacterium sp. Aquia_216]WAJ47101.1 hypothetical protein OK015_11990 [Mycobacterium sp. Aquia_216]